MSRQSTKEIQEDTLTELKGMRQESSDYWKQMLNAHTGFMQKVIDNDAATNKKLVGAIVILVGAIVALAGLLR